jgi:curved DNA-binding protein CbpA
MKITDAASILKLSGSITPALVKTAFRAQAKKYHPDVNPAGEEMMKVVNAAFDVLKNYEGTLDEDEENSGYPEALNESLNAIIGLSGLVIEICGSWVWVSGDTFPHKAILKENGFKYAGKKKSWHFRPEGWKSSSRGKTTMDDIRNKYGSTSPIAKDRPLLASRGG